MKETLITFVRVQEETLKESCGVVPKTMSCYRVLVYFSLKSFVLRHL